MGVIQSNINQILGTATIGAGLYAHSPMGQKVAELRQLKAQQPIIEQAMETMESGVNKNTPNEVIAQTYDQAIGNAQRQFELKPTKENYENWQGYMAGKGAALESPQVQAAEKAYQSMSAEQERIKAQKSLIDQFKEMPKEDRTQFLKESQHYQAQQKRGGK